jgi:hypothetical protein
LAENAISAKVPSPTKSALEAKAQHPAEDKKAAVEAMSAERHEQEARTGKKAGGRDPQAPDPDTATPDLKAPRNFTDAESRIMPSGSQKGAFVQGYNAQIAALAGSIGFILVNCDSGVAA